MRDKRAVTLALALETGADVRTVGRWLDGKLDSRPLDWAFRQAARMLKLVDDVDAVRAGSVS